jgi:DNA recombination protein Rad52
MDSHITELRQQISNKQAYLLNLETKQTEKWGIWSESEKSLSEIQIKREQMMLNEMRKQLNETIIAYNHLKENHRVAAQAKFGERKFSAEFVQNLQTTLSIPLAAEDISTRVGAGRQNLIYLETFKAIEKAREIFGFDFGIEVIKEPSILFQMNNNNKLAMKAVVRITLANGCYHEDVGVGVSTMSDQFEGAKMAAKAAISDGIKRALQHFGPALGSCLRDKEWVNHDIKAAGASRNTPSRDQSEHKRYKLGDDNNSRGNQQNVGGNLNNGHSSVTSSSNFNAPPPVSVKPPPTQSIISLVHNNINPAVLQGNESVPAIRVPASFELASSKMEYHANDPVTEQPEMDSEELRAIEELMKAYGEGKLAGS